MAPVVGSGRRPPWIERVAKAGVELSLLVVVFMTSLRSLSDGRAAGSGRPEQRCPARRVIEAQLSRRDAPLPGQGMGIECVLRWRSLVMVEADAEMGGAFR